MTDRFIVSSIPQGFSMSIFMICRGLFRLWSFCVIPMFKINQTPKEHVEGNKKKWTIWRKSDEQTGLLQIVHPLSKKNLLIHFKK